MNSFDMSSLIKDMRSLKVQIKLLQEAQGSTLSVHAALCQNEQRGIKAKKIGKEKNRPTYRHFKSQNQRTPGKPLNVTSPLTRPL